MSASAPEAPSLKISLWSEPGGSTRLTHFSTALWSLDWSSRLAASWLFTLMLAVRRSISYAVSQFSIR